MGHYHFFQVWCWLYWSTLWKKGLQCTVRCSRPCSVSVRLNCSCDWNNSDCCHLCGGPLHHQVSNSVATQIKAYVVPPCLNQITLITSPFMDSASIHSLESYFLIITAFKEANEKILTFMLELHKSFSLFLHYEKDYLFSKGLFLPSNV